MAASVRLRLQPSVLAGSTAGSQHRRLLRTAAQAPSTAGCSAQLRAARGLHPSTQAHPHACAAGGTELHFQRLPGVVATCVGYTQGKRSEPTYKEVCSGRTGHTEAVLVLFKPSEVSFTTLCEKLMSTIDPTLLNQVGQARALALALARALALALALARTRTRTLAKSRETRGARVGARLDGASRPCPRRAGDHHHAVSHLSLELLPRPHAARHLQLVHGRLSSGRPGVLLRTEQGRVNNRLPRIRQLYP